MTRGAVAMGNVKVVSLLERRGADLTYFMDHWFDEVGKPGAGDGGENAEMLAGRTRIAGKQADHEREEL